MGCEALLCPIKPFPIALLCSCLPAKASELSRALLPTEFQKRGSLNHCISEYLHRGDSHTLQSLPSSSTWAGQGCNPTKLHPNPQPWSEPKPPNSANSSRWAGMSSLFSPAGPAFPIPPGAASPHSLLRLLLRLFWFQIPAVLTGENSPNTFSSPWGSL